MIPSDLVLKAAEITRSALMAAAVPVSTPSDDPNEDKSYTTGRGLSGDTIFNTAIQLLLVAEQQAEQQKPQIVPPNSPLSFPKRG